jgi:hypothetical protein
MAELPKGLFISGNPMFQVKSMSGTVIANGYRRIVIGDYGAFVEFSEEQAVKSAMKIEPGQEYRIRDKNYADRVKYWWLTAKDDSGIKIYFQLKTVSYADYLPRMFYVCPHEIKMN